MVMLDAWRDPGGIEVHATCLIAESIIKHIIFIITCIVSIEIYKIARVFIIKGKTFGVV